MLNGSYENKKQELLNALIMHFPEYPLPNDDEILGYSPYAPDMGFDPEARGFYDAYRGQPWSWITPERISGLATSIWFLGPIGFKYYLPGFLTYALQSDFDMSLGIVHTLGEVLIPAPIGLYPSEGLATKMRLFDQNQLNTLLTFVELAIPLSYPEWREYSDIAAETAILFWSNLADKAGRDTAG